MPVEPVAGANAPVYKLFIGGAWVPSQSGRTFESVNQIGRAHV